MMAYETFGKNVYVMDEKTFNFIVSAQKAKTNLAIVLGIAATAFLMSRIGKYKADIEDLEDAVNSLETELSARDAPGWKRTDT